MVRKRSIVRSSLPFTEEWNIELWRVLFQLYRIVFYGAFLSMGKSHLEKVIWYLLVLTWGCTYRKLRGYLSIKLIHLKFQFRKSYQFIQDDNEFNQHYSKFKYNKSYHLISLTIAKRNPMIFENKIYIYIFI